MPVTPSYPGIYIEELPSTSKTIAAAPTSIAVFVGPTHPLKTKRRDKAVELFSFTDYEREFGGFYNGTGLDQNVAYAVNQFFLNGGGQAYVVGLVPANYTGATAKVGPITFTATEPTDPDEIEILITNVVGSSADLTITYGTRTPEIYRNVSSDPSSENFIETRLAGSTYVSVDVAPTSPPFSFTVTSPPSTLTLHVSPSATISAKQFNDVFDTDSDLDKLPIFNILVLPGVTNASVLATALAFAERKQAFVIVDPPSNSVAAQNAETGEVTITEYMNDTPRSPNGALYFPYLKSTNALSGDPIELPPSGFVAGIYARTDNNRGVWKAPAGLETTVLNTTGVVDDGRMNDMRQGKLNLAGINCLRTFPGIGTVVFGARTLVSANSAYEQWKYVPVRRMALFIEQTLYRNLGWAVFEPNDEPLWIALRTSVENFMLSLFKSGAFQGGKPSEAFFVRCDATTTTQTDINLGKVNIIVAFAPLKPAEFVIVKIAQLAGQAQA